MEKELVERTGIPFKTIPAAGVHGVSFKRLPANLVKLWQGYWKSKQLIKEFNPDVLLFTGGYVAIPMALAGIKRESLLYVPDIQPGLALNVLAKYSDRIAVTSEKSRKYFKHQEKITVTGYPIREDLKNGKKQMPLHIFNLILTSKLYCSWAEVVAPALSMKPL